jgi:hypothetical protein
MLCGLDPDLDARLEAARSGTDEGTPVEDSVPAGQSGS